MVNIASIGSFVESESNFTNHVPIIIIISQPYNMVNLTDLASSMKGKDTLSGWDVLVSYNEVQLNALLEIRAQALSFEAPLSWNADYKG